MLLTPSSTRQKNLIRVNTVLLLCCCCCCYVRCRRNLLRVCLWIHKRSSSGGSGSTTYNGDTETLFSANHRLAVARHTYILPGIKPRGVQEFREPGLRDPQGVVARHSSSPVFGLSVQQTARLRSRLVTHDPGVIEAFLVLQNGALYVSIRTVNPTCWSPKFGNIHPL